MRPLFNVRANIRIKYISYLIFGGKLHLKFMIHTSHLIELCSLYNRRTLMLNSKSLSISEGEGNSFVVRSVRPVRGHIILYNDKCTVISDICT